MFFASILIPVILITSIFAVVNTGRSKQQNQQHVNNLLLTESTNIASFLNETKRISSAPYLYDDIYSALKQMKEGAVSEETAGRNAMVNRYDLAFIKLMYNSSADIKNIVFYPASKTDNKIYLLSRENGDLQVLDTSDYFDRDWFIRATENEGGITFSEIHNVSYPDQRECKNVITLTRSIKDFDTQKSIGVLRVDASADVITDILDQINTAEKSSVLLLNESNTAVYKSKKISQDILSQLKFSKQSVKDNSDTYYVDRQAVSDTGWQLAYLSSESDLFASTTGTVLSAVLISLLSLFVAFVIFNIRSKEILSSIQNIIQTIRTIQKGDLTARSTVETQDELSMISGALNEMSEKLNRHIETEYKAKISQRNAEYRALQSQINPHFFYNTLNGFIALNRMGETGLLEKSILELTQLFRYTCSRETVTAVGEELEFVKRYLELQKLRFEERLNYTIEADPQALPVQIPKLLLQPIVENCIVHGMEPTEDPIHIRVTAEITADRESVLILTVADDGIGFSTEELQGSSNIGLANTQERLRYFNPLSDIRVENAPKKGTVCVIRLPINRQ